MKPTYGTLHFATPTSEYDLPARWVIDADPQVRIRIKRIFGRIYPTRSGQLYLTHTTEVARDLEWFMERHPLRMDAATRRQLKAAAREHRDRERTVAEILTGRHEQLPLVEPARPAREYQLIAADLAVTTGHVLVTDELGLGKSMTGILVMRAPEALPALVVTLTHLPAQWAEEIRKTFPWLKVHIVKGTTPYDPKTRRGVKGDPDVLVMNYHKLSGWADYLAGKIKTVIFDEAQELRRGPGWGMNPVKKYVAAAQIADRANYKVGLTATPVYNYGGEIHNVINVLAPDALGSKEEFIREWGAGSWNDNIKVADPAALGAFLRAEGLMIGRTRKEVGRELPEVIRITQQVEADEATFEKMAGDAAEMARLILATTTESKERWKISGELDWKMRQATGIAKAPYVAEFVRLLLESEEQVVLWGWHRAVYDIWAERLKDLKPVFFTGEESVNQKRQAEEAFKSGDSRLLIMSLRSGAGLDGLQEVSHVAVFGELDWSPQVHGQCIGRLHRDGQDDPVVAYFLVSDHGSDPVIAEVLNLKRMQSEPLLSPDGALLQQKTGNFERIKLLAEDVLRRAEDDVNEDEAAS